jgi:hypothetical protein
MSADDADFHRRRFLQMFCFLSTLYSSHLKILFLKQFFIVNHVLKVLIVPKVPLITKTEF